MQADSSRVQVTTGATPGRAARRSPTTDKALRVQLQQVEEDLAALQALQPDPELGERFPDYAESFREVIDELRRRQGLLRHTLQSTALV